MKSKLSSCTWTVLIFLSPERIHHWYEWLDHLGVAQLHTLEKKRKNIEGMKLRVLAFWITWWGIVNSHDSVVHRIIICITEINSYCVDCESKASWTPSQNYSVKHEIGLSTKLHNFQRLKTYGGFKLLMSGPSLDGLTSRLLAVLLPLPPLLFNDFDELISMSKFVSLPICLKDLWSPKLFSNFNLAMWILSALSADV